MTASVTAIIPCYNCEETIERAVDSIALQSVRPERVIAVDDASTDGTGQKLRSLVSRYGADWLSIITLKKNVGPGVARNIGWNDSSSTHLAFLDADDAWLPSKIELQFNWMQRHLSAVLTSHLSARGDFYPSMRTRQVLLPCSSTRIAPISLLFKNGVETRTVMVRRDIALRFKPEKRRSEDYLLWLELAWSGHIIFRLETELAHTFKRPYGQSGLTEGLVRMQAGELETYWSLFSRNLAPWHLAPAVFGFSFARFARRLAINANAKSDQS